ncbi:MAG TPA: gamma-glutamyl-gamma-aminobutyrate hydrolase family protein, partial [Candidatus Nitrosotenuis sp.]|nr:gamma-glutamyl-gamma-aminobutyrate hydrolase family protein [Candidatus Nitrosotenuis sp.]
AAGGEPMEVSLRSTREETEALAESLDAIVLSGSPADVDSSWYHAPRHVRTAAADWSREQTDFALLDAAFRAQKPVLAICYGVQLLNVYLGGNLVQHIPEEIDGALEHEKDGQRDRYHPIRIEEESRLAQLAGGTEVTVNTSHHQSILRTGRGLRIVARAPDGVIEAVELRGEGEERQHWVTGVQWHPERMSGDPLAERLFAELLAAVRQRVS